MSNRSQRASAASQIASRLAAAVASVSSMVYGTRAEKNKNKNNRKTKNNRKNKNTARQALNVFMQHATLAAPDSTSRRRRTLTQAAAAILKASEKAKASNSFRHYDIEWQRLDHSRHLFIAAELYDRKYPQDWLALEYLKRGADPNFVDDDTQSSGYTPLIMAAEVFNYPVAKVLIQFGADTNVRDTTGRAAIHRLAMRKPKDDWEREASLKFADYLFKAPVPASHSMRDPNGTTPLFLAACVTKFPGMVRKLLAAGANPNLQERSELVPSYLLPLPMMMGGPTPKNTIRVGQNKASLLCKVLESLSCDSDTVAIVDALVSYGAKVNVRCSGNTPLHMMAEDFIKVNDREAIRCSFAIIDRLLRAGATVDARGTYGETPLMTVVRLPHSGRIAAFCARRYLDAGADPLAQNQEQESPVSLALEDFRENQASARREGRTFNPRHSVLPTLAPYALRHKRLTPRQREDIITCVGHLLSPPVTPRTPHNARVVYLNPDVL